MTTKATVTAKTSVATNTLCRRIIPCLDIANGRTVKGVKFQELRDAGDPVELSLLYEEQGADELVFLDITASHEGRKTTLDLVAAVARQLTIPLTVGGGISTVDDVALLLNAGADKVSINTSAVKNPDLINQIATSFGSQCCVVAIDARSKQFDRDAVEQGEVGWKVLIRGGREDTGLDAFEWGKEAVARGAGEILLTSWDKDGTRDGFDIPMMKKFSSLPVPIIASGGASGVESFVEVFTDGRADAALAASIFHFSDCTVSEIKQTLFKEGVSVRLC